MLSESKGLASLFRPGDLFNDPVEILNFFVPNQLESQVLKSIIRECRLYEPGRGSIFSKHITTFNGFNDFQVCNVLDSELSSEEELQGISIFRRLTQISCTVSRGLADDIARPLLHLGVVPVVSNASGTGLRDQLGLLRITIPREKEFLSIVVGQQEANEVLAKMIEWGKLDRPGRGFIWQNPVEKGLINFKASQRSIGQAASVEQMIAAIDSLKGNFYWRQGNSTLSTNLKRDYFSGQELLMQVNEGDSIEISKAMLRLGISGATVQTLRTLTTKSREDNIIIPQEIVRVVVTDKQVKRIQQSIHEMDTILSEKNINIIPVPRAFNFKLPS